MKKLALTCLILSTFIVKQLQSIFSVHLKRIAVRIFLTLLNYLELHSNLDNFTPPSG